MPTWKLKIEYDGTRYCGWQQQPNGRSIQGELLKAANFIFNDRVEIGGAGRTDAGVHAIEQVAHLRSKKILSPQHIQINFDKLLPKDINVFSVESASNKFDARHDALSRHYIYQISTRRSAFGKPYVWWVKDKLDIELMKQACKLLPGMHDFSSFCDLEENKSTLVKVETANIYIYNSLVLFHISASHFLWKMVRRIVGTLVELGRKKISINQFYNLLTEYSNLPASWTAPPSGLFLERIVYSNDNKDDIINPTIFIS
jgi:tRNA pseudouridine38-40 synthase